MTQQDERLRTLCVGRHSYLSDHLARFFTELGMNAQGAVGLDDALFVSRDFDPQVVVCEYELLTTLSLDAWEQDYLLSRMPVIAVSLTRRFHEAQLLDVNGIGGFLYLPSLERDAAIRLLTAAAKGSRSRYVPAPPSNSIAMEVEARL